ncbi:transcriptional regulator, XRE family with cupin sensor [Paenibacillus catalpae]|uniref:Transcriptional regulator, XRE family with cupin sensor n=1 Tax=Paenibacillus catalpae TaxID=1045775 RepID=A0A1I1TE06_9BACL|nr:XRE family transcriptional regulator [Paenibacillus catalpae]SFD56861.1 transcriptional regulator, XRE family with cupin sensor [Paenibacillus catalpae]
MELGKRIRLIRKEQKRTQDEVSAACGFTKSMLSKIENGSTMPAVATLMKIASALGVKVSDLLEPSPSNGTVYIHASDYEDPDKWIRTDKGYSFFAFASGRRDKMMQPYLFVAERGEVKSHVFSHEGQEFIYVLSGQMKYKVGSTEYVMNAGDGMYFNSLEEHLVIPISEQVKYLAIFTEDTGKLEKD